MKYFLFCSVLFTVFSGTALSTSAQPKGHSRSYGFSDEASMPIKFIEGIEINRELVPAAEIIVPVVSNKRQVSASTGPDDVEKSSHIQFKYAQLLGRNVESISNIPLFNFIESWWETPYRFGGTAKTGVDCSGFSGLLFNNVYNTEIPRTARDQYFASEKIARDKLTEGDLVFFNTKGGVSHVGVYLSDGYFVHAGTSFGVSISNLNDDYYSARFLGGGRIAQSADSMVNAGVQAVNFKVQ